MKLFYLFSFIILFLTLTFLKRSDKKYSVLNSVVYFLGVIYFLNIFIALVFSALSIKNSLLLFSLVYFFFSGLFIFLNFKRYKKVKFQEYYFDIKAFFGAILIFLICFVVGYIRFEGFTSIVYETTDSAVHYKASHIYSENMLLIDKSNFNDELYDNAFSHMMPGYYVNAGLFSKVSITNNYTSYLIYDTLFFALLSLTFFVTCLTIKKQDKNHIITVILTLLYSFAYCFNDVIFGFGYLGAGILSFNLILLTWYFISKYNKNYLYILLSLFNFGLFFSYYLFLPSVFLAQGIYIIYKFIKKEYSLINFLIIGFGTLIIPFIIGFVYFIAPGLFNSGTTPLNSYSIEGYIYRDLWSNFVLILPLFIYSFVLQIRNKKIDINLFFICFEVLFIFVTFIFGLYGKVSSYYYFKSYYILWLILYIYIYKLVNYNDFNTKCFLRITVAFMCFILAVAGFKFEERIQSHNILFNNNTVAPSFVNVYWFNVGSLTKHNNILGSKEIDLIYKIKEYENECFSNENEIPILANYMQKLWIYSLIDVVPIYNHKIKDLSQFYTEKFDYEKFLTDENARCIVVLNSYNNKNNDMYIDLDNNAYSIVYKNSSGSILKKVN